MFQTFFCFILGVLKIPIREVTYVHNSLAVFPADKWQTISDRGVNLLNLLSTLSVTVLQQSFDCFLCFFFLGFISFSILCEILVFCCGVSDSCAFPCVCFPPFLSLQRPRPAHHQVLYLALHYYPGTSRWGFSSFWLWECCHSMDPLKLLFTEWLQDFWWSSGSDSCTSHAEGAGSTPDWRTEILHTLWADPHPQKE